MVSIRTLSDNVLGRYENMPLFDVWWAHEVSPPSPLPTVLVHDAQVKADLTEQYVVAYPDAGGLFQGRHGAVADALDWGCTFVCVARSRAQVATLIGNVRTRNAGFTPDPDGNTWAEQNIGARIIPDLGDPTKPTFSFTLRFTLTTRS
jgi:hypothetical protein